MIVFSDLRRLALDGFTVTDNNVKSLYKDKLSGAFAVPAGEAHKNFETLERILSAYLKAGLNRKSKVYAVGGGVVGDMTGFASSIYMRGIEWVSVPTTLLAMVDSGIGGKTAIDFNGVKNCVGTFHEAERTVICPEFIHTLPNREMKSGLGEIIKTMCLTEYGYGFLLNNMSALASLDAEKHFDEYKAAIRLSVEIKEKIVTRDPRELTGERKKLNVGHTLGHAFEAADGMKLSHGEYVMKGMLKEFDMFRDEVDPEFYAVVTGMLKQLTTEEVADAERVAEFAAHDKKNADGLISIMLVTAPGVVEEKQLKKRDFLKRYGA